MGRLSSLGSTATVVQYSVTQHTTAVTDESGVVPRCHRKSLIICKDAREMLQMFKQRHQGSFC